MPQRRFERVVLFDMMLWPDHCWPSNTFTHPTLSQAAKPPKPSLLNNAYGEAVQACRPPSGLWGHLPAASQEPFVVSTVSVAVPSQVQVRGPAPSMSRGGIGTAHHCRWAAQAMSLMRSYGLSHTCFLADAQQMRCRPGIWVYGSCNDFATKLACSTEGASVTAKSCLSLP